jgi:hypothetical protein
MKPSTGFTLSGVGLLLVGGLLVASGGWNNSTPSVVNSLASLACTVIGFAFVFRGYYLSKRQIGPQKE